jgi:nicotinate-nucleotide adenylyltransferase
MNEPPVGGSRVAFFGGSFDPPHLGHLAVARAAREALGLDSVLFAPVGAQPLKPRGSTVSFVHRLAMTRLAIAGEPGFAVSLADAPEPSGAPNYTLETLLALRAELPPESALFCLMGADSFAGFRRWHRAAEIPFVAPLIIASRPGQPLDLKAALPEGLEIVLERFSNTCALASTVKGDFYFHPSDEDLSLGARLRKKSLNGMFSEYSNWRTAMLSQPGAKTAEIELHSLILRNAEGALAPLYLLPSLEFPISASEIREQMQMGEPVCAATGGLGLEGAFLPASVADYIQIHSLYR